MATTVQHTDTYFAVVDYTIAQLTAMIDEARENWQDACHAANKTTVEEGYTPEQWQAAATQAVEAEMIYMHLYQIREEKYKAARLASIEKRRQNQEYAEPEPYRGDVQ